MGAFVDYLSKHRFNQAPKHLHPRFNEKYNSLSQNNMLSFKFCVCALFLTNSLVNGLTISPISVVTQLVPVTLTWSQQTGDPRGWLLLQKDLSSRSGGFDVVGFQQSAAQHGELLITFASPDFFQLAAMPWPTELLRPMPVTGNLRFDLPVPSGLTKEVFVTLDSVTVIPQSTSSSGVRMTFSPTAITSTKTSMVLPSFESGSLTSIRSLSPSSTEESHSQPNNTPKIATILGGIVGSVGCMFLAGFLVFRRRKMRRIGGEASGSWARGEITPFQSHLEINQNSGSPTGFMISDQRCSEERGSSEIAIVDGGDESESTTDSVAAGRNTQIPIRHQFRSASRVFNRMKTDPKEKKKVNDSNRQEVSDQIIDQAQAVGLTPEASASALDRVPVIETRNNRMQDVLRHLDSGSRMMAPYRLTRTHETRPTDGGRSGPIFEDIIELPPEYSPV
ncbi:hypothetical protein K435DRAFT_857450 [Dendrothele bispora CBS 962.96]|uniref:Uncharacterized protein n=1 Tax=Dendrothele bispora (strain CBS 962.96) TaxID=1314807 RepID=A0A4S8M6C1_DENBC|nr:hypothetical protein K435DRAFT_857450 [Dendrothele bispora CBS 962.96]